MITADADDRLLARTLKLAEKGLYTTPPNPRVGCVICRNGDIIGEGWHQRAGGEHAEINALAQAGKNAAGADIYVSMEPCTHHGKTPPCVDALVAARPARVIVALSDPNPKVAGAGIKQLQNAGIKVTVADNDSAVARAAKELNIGFISRMTRRRPWLRLKIAATLDGKTALDSGLSRWISGDTARRDAHHLRARSCAVLTGIGTALQDNPALTVRHIPTSRQPLRLLLDSKLRATADMKLFADDNALIITAAPPTTAAAAAVLSLPNTDGKVNLPRLFAELAAREMNEITVEAGRKLNGALLTAGLVDEIVLYLAARIFGESGKDMFAIPAAVSPQQATRFRRVELRDIGDDDIKIVYRHAADKNN